MKGLILLFFTLAGFGVVWGYLDKDGRKAVKTVVRKNLLPISLAAGVVAAAVLFSLNGSITLI